ncbi:hypothetical protein MGG_17941 [Pyricularia oryzae 70-15]|uniref:Uncharacterized protein n=2 Tax=Pyricularia oryzae TaxID=318829 RepID=G5EH62_PYRO7|nr:uncharacterized protein MGG_17941 [Pyricularia oryzae 70-15]ELQ43457.1 hypothetical protein OOU_Y34scaffold00150g4 [Pyricularia oryzae Y34]KAI7920142.1 hypothetical protein M0657_006734 [Pyricularia oryzae]EAQ71237.1 hypothetical protein MGCH7_ch7g644 [Pyricularia oryzae 70-15]EHA46104.1 hypothetical protein MGG_17941 [Pyricularia oryzae 70-15]KAI7922937.1 hypothetical protein M9X92_004598 [Pyricularia oryzae]
MSESTHTLYIHGTHHTNGGAAMVRSPTSGDFLKYIFSTVRYLLIGRDAGKQMFQLVSQQNISSRVFVRPIVLSADGAPWRYMRSKTGRGSAGIVLQDRIKGIG